MHPRPSLVYPTLSIHSCASSSTSTPGPAPLLALLSMLCVMHMVPPWLQALIHVCARPRTPRASCMPLSTCVPCPCLHHSSSPHPPHLTCALMSHPMAILMSPTSFPDLPLSLHLCQSHLPHVSPYPFPQSSP